MAFRSSCRLALRAARLRLGSARPALAVAATAGSLAVGAAAFSKPSGCQAPTLVDVSGLTKVGENACDG